jgi:predicted RNA binding protein YcfA (HicA-like mRNA interferase family)
MRLIHDHGCQIVRDTGKHTIVHNPANGRRSVVPRHKEINEHTAHGILKQLGIEQ